MSGRALRVLALAFGLWAVLIPIAQAELSIREITLDIELIDTEITRPEVELLFVAPVQQAQDSEPFGLYVVANDYKDARKRALLRYSFTADGWKPEWQQSLDPDVALLQLNRGSEQQTPPRLLGYSNGAVVELNTASRLFVSKLPVPTIYRSDVSELAVDIELGQDITGDGLVDVLVPDFDGWHFAGQKPDGSFLPAQRFGPRPVMGMGSKRYVYFTAYEPYAFDHNRDGRLDVGFWKNNAMRVYYQESDGGFAEQPVTFTPGVDIASDAFFELSVGEDVDNPTGRQAILDGIEDLNGDSLPDLLVYSITGEGLFGKETSYEIYLGKESAEGTLEFESTPSSAVGSGGIQIDVDRQDLDGDGQLEMIVTSFNLGLGSIIRGLLSRSANLDLSIYKLQDGRYPPKPNVKRRITAKLDLSEGEVFVPAVVAGDVDGDGLKDLLIQSGGDELKVFPGTGNDGLFKKSAVSIEMALPLVNGKLDVLDIDTDGDDDLLVQFPGDAEAGSSPKVVAVTFDGEF